VHADGRGKQLGNELLEAIPWPAVPSNGIGIAPELATGRAVVWNVVFVAVEVTGAITAHLAFGVAWWQLVGGFAAVLALGGGLLVYGITVATPRALRRHEAMLRVHLTTSQFRSDDPSSADTSTTRTTTSGTGRAA
jgi:hypothetical protein